MKVLFVCRGNLTRSVIAEYCFKDFLKKSNILGFDVSSAGTDPHDKFEGLITTHLDFLKELGIDTSKHIPRQLTKKMLKEYDIIISMDEKNSKIIEDEFKIKPLLFNEVAFGKKESIKIDWIKPKEEVDKQLKELVLHMQKIMPIFYTNLKKYIKK